MENLERFEGLSAAEVATLKNRRRVALIAAITTAAMYPVFAAVAILSRSWLYIILFFIITPLPILFIFLSNLRSILSLNKDIREGKKKIVANRIESQRQDIREVGGRNNSQMSYTYLIKVKGKELKVSESQYYQCKPGQLVELDIAPSSDYVFSLRVLEASASKGNVA